MKLLPVFVPWFSFIKFWLPYTFICLKDGGAEGC
jgi:hypothetical protein